jgi:hypothetical protein
MEGTFNTTSLIITPEMLYIIAELDEFKGAGRGLSTLAPERLSALRRVAAIESIGASTWYSLPCRARPPRHPRPEASRGTPLQREVGCVWVASRCRDLQRSAKLAREIIQSIEGFDVWERTLNLRVVGSIPTRLTRNPNKNQQSRDSAAG